MGGITSLFSIFHLALTDCPSALVGGADPSLPRHLDQRQTAELKCHFNFLAALVTAGLALSPGYSCNFHIMWCQKGYSPSISHSDLIHLSSLSVIPVVRWVRGRTLSRDAKDKLLHCCPLSKRHRHSKAQENQTSTSNKRTHHHCSAGGKATNFEEALHLQPLTSFAFLPPDSLLHHPSSSASPVKRRDIHSQ